MTPLQNQSTTTLLQYEPLVPKVYLSLQALKRTGWVESGVQNPESVKEHTEALLALALELTPRLSQAETEGLAQMLEVHDWPEATCGDVVILESDPENRTPALAAKYENEERAMVAICKDLPNGDEILAAWRRFEKSNDPAASLARQLDKYQAVEKALEYEETQGVALFTEFLEYSLPYITHPILRERIEVMRLRWESGRR